MTCRVPTCEERAVNGIQNYKLPLLSTYIASLKSAVTKYAHTIDSKFTWQKRYHDHAIRGTEDRNNISQYIENNITSWDNDCFNEQMLKNGCPVIHIRGQPKHKHKIKHDKTTMQ